MANYYPSLNSQKDNLQGPYPGDQKLAAYSELQSHHSNVSIYENQASVAGSYSEFLSGNSLTSQNCAEFTSVGDRNEMMFIPPTTNMMNLQSIDGHLNTAAAEHTAGNHVNGDSQVVSRSQLGILDSEQNYQSQGLSLSLGTDMQSAVSVPSFQYQNPNLVWPSVSSQHLPMTGKWNFSYEGDESSQSKGFRISECFSTSARGNHSPIKRETSHNLQCLDSRKDIHDTYMYAPSGYANATLNTKYLKAAQQLLDEMVSVRKALKQHPSNKSSDDNKETDGGSKNQSVPPISSGLSSGPSESITNSSSELSPAEQQELQNKKTKLLSMLDEVDRRYKQYYHQMQIMVSYFDMVAGHGEAKAYTALALQTISRHFRCLRDAICGQVEITRKKLGEQDTSSNGQGGIPRLRYVDQQLRQQRALQHLGVMRHAWRPQRGLPESSVSILRAWLFEHFLHPYPNDSEKIMLAKQTGLTRNQVANWFINARVRLWKPMVEEIYKEEFADSEAISKSSIDDGTKACGENHLASRNRLDDLQDSLTSAAAENIHSSRVHDMKSDLIPDIEMNKNITKTMLQNDSNEDYVSDSGIKNLQLNQRCYIVNHSPYPDKTISYDQHGDQRFMPAGLSYDISELSGFGIGNQVSLALGLQSHETDSFPISVGNHIRSNNADASSIGPDTMDYHCMDPGKQQDRFGNSHLLHDFVV